MNTKILTKKEKTILKKGVKNTTMFPPEIINKIPFKVGDVLDVDIKKNSVVFKKKLKKPKPSFGLTKKPKKISKDQEWFWTKEWQKKEKEADEDIKKGRIEGPFNNAKDLIKSLHSK